jgi:hypothetical protein
MLELHLKKVGLIKRIGRKILGYFLNGGDYPEKSINVPMDSGNDGFFVPFRGQVNAMATIGTTVTFLMTFRYIAGYATP